MCILGPERLTALCSSSLDGTMVPITYECSYNDGPSEDCESIVILICTGTCILIWIHACPSPSGGPGPEIIIDVEDFIPGLRVTLMVVLTTEGGQRSESTLIFTATGYKIFTLIIITVLLIWNVIIFSCWVSVEVFWCVRWCIPVILLWRNSISYCVTCKLFIWWWSPNAMYVIL